MLSRTILRGMPAFSAGAALCAMFGGAAWPQAPDGAVSGRAELRARIQAAPKLEVEKLCEPARGTRGGGLELVPNPDGKTYDALIRYCNTYWGPHTTVIIDLATGAMATHLRPSALYSGASMGPDGRYYSTITGKGGTAFQVYDPATNSIHDLDAIAAEVGGETRPLCIGTDGMMYGAGSSKSRAIIYQLNPATGAVTMYGHVGPSHAPADCWGYTVAADDAFVYVVSGKTPWYLLAYHRATKETAVLLTNDDPKGYVGVSQMRFGCAAVSQYFAGETRKSDYYWLYQGQAVLRKDAKEKAPWDEPADAKPWFPSPPRPEVGAAGLLPKADGRCELWYRLPEDRAKASRDAPADAKPEDLGWKVARFTVPTFAYDAPLITGLPDGRVAGSGGNYLGAFIYDSKTSTYEHPGIIKLSHYSTAVLDGKVYLSGYPSSALYEWDPAKPWTANTSPKPWLPPVGEDKPESNPRRLTYLAHDGSGCHKMLAAASAAGKVFFGGRWYRNGEGGGLGWWDPKAGKAGGMDLPFRCYQVHYMTATPNERYLVISTMAARDLIGNQPEPESGKVFVFDTQEMKIVHELIPVAGAKIAGAVAGVEGTCALGITYNPGDRNIPDYKGKHPPTYGHMDQTAILYKINAATGELLWTKTLPYPVGILTNENAQGKDGFAFTLGPDGKVWTFTGGRFTFHDPQHDWYVSYLGPDLCMARIDPKDGAMDIVGRLDWGGQMAFSGKDVILSGGCRYLLDRNTWLRRVRNVVP